MKLGGHTVLITGGGTGIGAGLAGAFHGAGSRVIICGRREEAPKKTVGAHPGMEYLPLDVRDFGAVIGCAGQAASRHPSLDVVINNAGVQKFVDFNSGAVDQGSIDEVVDTKIRPIKRRR